MPRISYLVRYSPIPQNAGGKIRIHAIWQALQKIGTVRLVVIGDKPSLCVRRDLAANGAWIYPPRREKTRCARYLRYLQAAARGQDIPSARFLSPKRRSKLISRLSTESPDTIVIGDTYLSVLIPELKTLAPRVVIDTHNVESVLARRIAACQRNPLMKWRLLGEAYYLERIERRFLGQSSAVWAVSEEDAAHYREILPSVPVHVVPNVVDVARYRSDVRSHEPTIVFTGWYRHWPNQDAARFLIKCSRQLLSEGVHHRLYLVGRDMPESIRREAADQDQIVVTGEVPDVVPYLAQATVFAAPMRAASGSNLKILEAMALGKPVVTTTMGAEGLPIERGVHAAVATDPESFYGLLRHHLIRRDESEKMGQMGARWVCENMSSEALERRIHDIMEHGA